MQHRISLNDSLSIINALEKHSLHRHSAAAGHPIISLKLILMTTHTMSIKVKISRKKCELIKPTEEKARKQLGRTASEASIGANGIVLIRITS